MVENGKLWLTKREIKEFYKDKKNFPCPITEEFIKAGYQQESGGYIESAKNKGVTRNYLEAKPTQYWHLIENYLSGDEDLDVVFSRTVRCGELYIWMAEVSEAFTSDELEELTKKILEKTPSVNRRNKELPPLKTLRENNEEIRDYCFDRIMRKVREELDRRESK